MNRRALNSTTDIDLFEEGIKLGKLNVRPKKIGIFTCGSFMRNIKPNIKYISQKDGMNTIIYIDHSRWGYEKDLVDWWMSMIKELGIDAEYFGKENDEHVIRYNVIESFNGNMRLLRFTILRYLWSTPYRCLVEHMYTLKDSPEVKKHGFWHVFMVYHARLSLFDGYSSTFGLTYPSKILNISNEDFIARFIKEGDSKYGINHSFGGDEFGKNKTTSIKFKPIKFDE